jgi:hypothetical protein
MQWGVVERKNIALCNPQLGLWLRSHAIALDRRGL